MSSQSDHSSLTNELLQSGYMTIPQMQQALIESRKTGRSLLEILPNITGHPLPSSVLDQHKKQHLFSLKILYGVEYFKSHTEIHPEKIAKIIESLEMAELCRVHQLLPLSLNNQKPAILRIAMVDPSQIHLLTPLKQRLQQKGVELQRIGITLEDYQRLWSQIYPRASQATEMVSPTIVDVTEIFEQMPPILAAMEEEDISQLDQASEAPIIKLVNKILEKALTSKASEIHIDPQENLLSVRFRQDGLLQPSLDPLPIQVAPAILSRLKLMAEIDINQRQHLQKGQIQRNFAGRSVNLLINILPSQRGEKAIIKIIDDCRTIPQIRPFLEDSAVQRLIRRSSGLVLIIGPAHSGKTTTLYTLLSQKSEQGLSLVSLEDPIERTLPNVTQVQVNPQKERTYGKMLQSLLRQDVDVIFVDCLGDAEIAHHLTDAAARGRYILTSLDVPSIPHALTHLADLGMTASLLGDTLSGIINQRLIRRLCPTCRLIHEPDAAQKAKFGLSPSPTSLYKANVLNPTAIEQAQVKGRLCRTCNGQGYQGQVGIYEVFNVDPSLKALISQKATAEQLLTSATQAGMSSLLDQALTFVYAGETTLDEIERLFGHDLTAVAPSLEKPTTGGEPNLVRRLTAIEELLTELTREFDQLKQEIYPIAPSPTSLSPLKVTSPAPISPPLSSEGVKFFEKTIAYGETIASPDGFYEELNDPGDWNKLKRELDPSKETITIDFAEEEAQSFPHHPFKVPDPWA